MNTTVVWTKHDGPRPDADCWPMWDVELADGTRVAVVRRDHKLAHWESMGVDFHAFGFWRIHVEPYHYIDSWHEDYPLTMSLEEVQAVALAIARMK